MTFDTDIGEKVFVSPKQKAEDLSKIRPHDMSNRRGHKNLVLPEHDLRNDDEYIEGRKINFPQPESDGVYVNGNEYSFPQSKNKSSQEESGGNLWGSADTIQRAKEVIFASNTEPNKVSSLFNSFIEDKYGVKTVEAALNKAADPYVGKNVTKGLLASDFLHYLGKKRRWDIISQIEKTPLKSIEKVITKYSVELDEKALDRIAGDGSKASEDLKKRVQVFMGVWGDIDEFTLGIRDGAIHSIGIQGGFINENGRVETRRVSLPMSIIQKIFSGVDYYKKHEYDYPIGLQFGGKEGEYIRPDMTEEEIKEVLLKVYMSGQKPNNDLTVHKEEV